jgi:hypothetical protein
MNVYEIHHDSDSFRRLVTADFVKSDPLTYWPTGTDLDLQSWDPPVYRNENPSSEGYEGERPLGDFAGLDASNDIVLRAKAIRAVGDVLRKYGALLPVVYQDTGEILQWFHCMTQIDALIEDRTIGLRLATGQMTCIDRYAFSATPLHDAMVFRLPQRKRGGELCTDRFKQLIEHHRLTGLYFKLRWSDEPEGMRRIMAWGKSVGYKNLPPLNS